jgi:hypothetical protein
VPHHKLHIVLLPARLVAEVFLDRWMADAEIFHGRPSNSSRYQYCQRENSERDGDIHWC